MKVSQFMTCPVMVISEDERLETAATLMIEKGIGCLPVVDHSGRLSGIITESDFSAQEKGVPFSTFRAPQLFGHWVGQEGVEKLYQAAREIRVREVMRREVFTLTQDQEAEEVIRMMLAHRLHRLPVVEDGVPVGVVTRRNLLRLMISEA